MNGAGDSRNLEPQDSSGGPPGQPAEDSNSDGNQRATRNITVSIQYSYFTPHRFANLNNNNDNNNNNDQEVPANDPGITIPGLGFPVVGNEGNGGGVAPEGGNNPDPAAAAATNAVNAAANNAARPDGALVLSFRDVPVSTPQERLESIISIAAELAMRRFSDIMSIPKGITREQFEQLPVVQVSSLPEKQDTICSICYENYEDEPSTPLKRARDGEDMEDEEDLDSVKKRRSESPGSSETMETAPSHPLEHSDNQEEGNGSHVHEEQRSETAQQQPEAPQQDSSQQGEESQKKYLHSPVQLPCAHIFGRECLDKWSQIENSCPLCRRKIVEVQPEQRPEPGNPAGTTNMEAFERIRQLLYNSPAEQQQQQQQQQQLQQQQLQQQPQQQALGSIEETNPDGYLGQVLLKQQEELRIALERQQEVNKKLEEQLEANRVQQERLQRVLGEQDVTAHKFISSESASPQSATKTPANNGKSSTIIGDDGNIIVTSNSNNGGYKFPPPANLEPPAYGPGSHTAMNGSPPRKVSRGRTPPINDDLREDADEDVAMTNYLRPEIEQKEAVADSSHFLKKRNAQPGFTNGFSIQDQTRSPVNTRSTVHHNKKESTISTVSTIPQHLDDNENSDSDSGGLLGLGIQSMNGKRAVPRNYSLRPPPVDIMPPIPGSTDNTPIPKQPQLPQKHIFQHTPVKNQYPPVKSQHPPVQQPTQGYYSNAGISTGSGTSLGENPFRDPIATPQLKPPSDHSSRRNSGYSADHNEIIGGHKSDFNGEEQQMEDGDEPESRFIVAKTPSPVLKSQGRFEGSSPQYDTTNVSPIKITRKPSTLPRGSIDKYVKELPDKLFECQYHGCGKIFKRRYNIRSHIQTHLEDRPYMCDFEGCDKAFVRNHDLVRHKKSHAEKCYACPCGKKFNREDALIVHRSRMICSGGRRYENVVIKKSPRRRGRPKKDDYSSTHSSPVKETVERSNDGYLIYKMEEQLRNEMEEYGLLRPPPNLAVTNHALLLSPSPSSDNSDMGSPKYELKEPQKKP